ncbi:hypothetical protein BDN71DRAFT_1400671, partial [Pleurotus eryngii]
ISATKNSELTVQCPACLNPDINLPLNWQSTPQNKQMAPSVVKNPGLGTDWGYFIKSEPFCWYLLSVTDQKEMSMCSSLAALDYANTKFSRGYTATTSGNP